LVKVKRDICNLAFDFGASSGRLMMSSFDGSQIRLEELHRFPNEPVRLGGGYYWDFLRLFHELKIGLKKTAAKKIDIASIGIDSWGVDYGLLDRNDKLLANPYHYRDSRTDGLFEEVNKLIPYEEMQRITGLQYLQFNTIYQICADLKYRKKIFKEAKTMLFIPDLFGYFLTGNKVSEYTIASTSQMMDANKKTWAKDMLKKLGLPVNLLQDIIMPGELIGDLTSEIQEETGLAAVPLFAVGSHDTASAVAGTPLYSKSSAYLSCGTWSLLGIESSTPIINELSLKYNFTNEGGVENKIRFLKNINGLWLIQQLKKVWNESGKNISYGQIAKLAAKVDEPFALNPNADDFGASLNMVAAIQQYCQKAGQKVPQTIGEVARAAYNGITEQYKNTINEIEEIAQSKIDVINMVGGGIQDEFLCNLTAKATGKRVVAGPVEAAVLGNIIVQLISLGEIENIAQGREIIKHSFKENIYNICLKEKEF
jgi:rhamnulokinase